MQVFGPVGSSPATEPTEYSLLQNLGLAASVSGNALTISLKTAGGSDPSSGSPVKIGTRNSTLSTGTYNVRSVTGALSITVSSGSTLGTISGSASSVYVWAIDNSGTVELAVSASKKFDENVLQSTTAEGGAGAADDPNTLYSTTARTNVAVRLLGRVVSTQATAGTWATSPSEISLAPAFPKGVALYHFDTTNGYGATDTKIRRWTNNTLSSDPTGVLTVENSAANGCKITANRRCRVHVSYTDIFGATSYAGISRNTNAPTTGISGLTKNQRLTFGVVLADVTTQSSVCIVLDVGDILRPHTEGDAASVNASFGQMFIQAEEI